MGLYRPKPRDHCERLQPTNGAVQAQTQRPPWKVTTHKWGWTTPNPETTVKGYNPHMGLDNPKPRDHCERLQPTNGAGQPQTQRPLWKVTTHKWGWTTPNPETTVKGYNPQMGLDNPKPRDHCERLQPTNGAGQPQTQRPLWKVTTHKWGWTTPNPETTVKGYNPQMGLDNPKPRDHCERLQPTHGAGQPQTQRPLWKVTTHKWGWTTPNPETTVKGYNPQMGLDNPKPRDHCERLQPTHGAGQPQTQRPLWKVTTHKWGWTTPNPETTVKGYNPQMGLDNSKPRDHCERLQPTNGAGQPQTQRPLWKVTTHKWGWTTPNPETTVKGYNPQMGLDNPKPRDHCERLQPTHGAGQPQTQRPLWKVTTHKWGWTTPNPETTVKGYNPQMGLDNPKPRDHCERLQPTNGAGQPQTQRPLWKVTTHKWGWTTPNPATDQCQRLQCNKHKTLTQCWFDVGSTSWTLVQHQINIGSMSGFYWESSKHNAFILCWRNVGPASQTVAQH